MDLRYLAKTPIKKKEKKKKKKPHDLDSEALI
jgi:hypothetical protein